MKALTKFCEEFLGEIPNRPAFILAYFHAVQICECLVAGGFEIIELKIAKNKELRWMQNGIWIVVRHADKTGSVWVKEGGEICVWPFQDVVDNFFGGDRWETVALWRD